MIVVKSKHLNSFLYFNKIYNHHYCQVKPSFVYYLHSTPHDLSRVTYELCVLYELKLDLIQFMLIPNHSTFQALARSSQN